MSSLDVKPKICSSPTTYETDYCFKQKQLCLKKSPEAPRTPLNNATLPKQNNERGKNDFSPPS